MLKFFVVRSLAAFRLLFYISITRAHRPYAVDVLVSSLVNIFVWLADAAALAARRMQEKRRVGPRQSI